MQNQQQSGESHGDDTPADLNSASTPKQIRSSMPPSDWRDSVKRHDGISVINVEHGEDA